MNDIDKQIAELENQLNYDTENSEDSSSSAESESEENIIHDSISKFQRAGAAAEIEEKRKNFKPVTCEACKMELKTYDEHYKHELDVEHRQNVIIFAGKNYEPKRKKSLFCRACDQGYKTLEEFLAHRKTITHEEAEKKERKRSFCITCRKQFTSAVQLREHCAGRIHKEKMNKIRKRQKFRR
eukprot:snap_masked-scaffold_9-processed-gene-12.21-mRNA-1 protein AED:0.30 eAED:0.30 QI:0/-1/0/1/-1/1/1/0/182